MLKSLIAPLILAQIVQFAPPSTPGQTSLPTVRVSGGRREALWLLGVSAPERLERTAEAGA